MGWEVGERLERYAIYIYIFSIRDVDDIFIHVDAKSEPTQIVKQLSSTKITVFLKKNLNTSKRSIH